MDKVRAARIALLKAEAELKACLFEESAQGNPWVQAEDGHWMSDAEVAKALRDSWKKKV